MRPRCWPVAAFVALTLIPNGFAVGESRSSAVSKTEVDAVRFDDLRRQFAELRDAYMEWAERAARTAVAAGPDRTRDSWRQSRLEHEYQRLQGEMRQLIRERRRHPFVGGAGEGLAALEERARRLAAGLRGAVALDRRQAAAPARVRAAGDAAAVERARSPLAARAGAARRAGDGSGAQPVAGRAAERSVRDPDLDRSSLEFRILGQAEAALAGLRRQPTAELCRRGWERRSGDDAPTTLVGRRDRLDSYSRLVPVLERRLARMRDSAAEDERGGRIATAAELFLAALEPYGSALRGCSKGARSLCGRWQPAGTSGLGAPSTPRGALPGPEISPPGNDTCATATVIGTGTFSGDTTGATSDGESSCGSSGASPDVWYSYTAAFAETILFSTLGSAYDTVLSIHDGCPGDLGSELDCNDDWLGGQSQLSYDLAAGQTVLVRVSGFNGDAGAYDLSVGPPGSLSGTVTEAAGGAPLEWVDVEIVDHSGNTAGWGYTDSAGDYAVADLPAGSYYAYTWASWSQDSYVDELYAEPDNLPCPFGYCTVSDGTPIQVTLGTDTPGVDFPLEPGGSIVGSVTDAVSGDQLESGVAVYDTAGNHLTWGWTGGSPTYSAVGLPSGSFFAQSENREGYFDELWDDLPCPNPWSCAVTTGTPIPVTAPAATSGIDFALLKGGTISGKLVDAVTGLAVGGGGLTILSSTGEQWPDAWPDENGDYTTTTGLTSGVYFVRSFNWDGYVDELYDDIPCPGGCDESAGTPIAVTAGSDTGGIDLALKKQAGAIAGRVTDGVTGWPLADIEVQIYDPAGDWVTDGVTDENGDYLSYGSLTPGTYYAVTWNEEGYDDELWQEIDCAAGCDPKTGTAIDVTGYALGIDFTLEKGGAITGQVTDDATGAALAGVSVNIIDSTGTWVTDGYTDAAGNYISWDSLAPGTYYAVTYNEQGYFDELYDGIDCSSGCNATTGTPIVVSSYATGIDFALTKGGGISGTVTDAATGAPLEGVEVRIFEFVPWGIDWLDWVRTDAAGQYLSSRALQTGTYGADTRNWSGYIDELYDLGYCAGCWPGDGTHIAVTAGAIASGVDFALDKGAVVSGRITDAATAAPIADAWVDLYDLDRNSVADGRADAAGHYTTEAGLPSGSYYAIAQNGAGYVNELYDDVVCTGCEYASLRGGMPIALSAPLAVSGIDFALDRGARVTGYLLDAASGGGLGWCEWVEVYAGNHRWVTRGHADFSSGGWYETGAGLPPGDYYALAGSWCGGYATEAWDGLACPWGWCELPETTPITVASATDVTGIDFDLDPKGWITGQVTDEATNPLAVELYFFDAGGRDVMGEQLSDPSTGGYATPDDLCAGDYYVRTVNTSGLVDEVYNDIPCAGCDPAGGTPVVVAGVPVGGIDFALGAGGAISGQVTDASDGSPLAGVVVLFINSATGWAASYAETDGAGAYTSYGALSSGSYYVTTENEQGYVDELHDGAGGVACPGPLEFTWRRGCALASGLPVAVTSPYTTTGVDFALDAGGGIGGTVSWAMTGEPVRSEVWIYDASGNFIEEVWTSTGDYASLYGLPAGSYHAHTRNWEGYPDECYQDLPCPAGSCDPTLGTPIAVAAGTMTYGIDFALGSFACDALPGVVDVTGWLDHPALYLACSEIRVRDCQVGGNAELELISGGVVSLDEVSVAVGAEVIIRNQP